MRIRRWRRWLILPVAGVVLVFVAACGPTAKQTDCEQVGDNAKYTIKVTNESTDKTYKVRLLVSTIELSLDRDGENMTLEPGESKNYTVTIKKGEKKYVGVLWPGPKGDDTFKYREQLDSKC
jgi:hypothetical protein